MEYYLAIRMRRVAASQAGNPAGTVSGRPGIQPTLQPRYTKRN